MSNGVSLRFACESYIIREMTDEPVTLNEASRIGEELAEKFALSGRDGSSKFLSIFNLYHDHSCTAPFSKSMSKTNKSSPLACAAVLVSML
jgi:hypothetical protein